MDQDSLAAKARHASFLALPTMAGTWVAQLVAGPGLSFPQAISVALPSSAVLVLLGHSSWYLARAVPLKKDNAARLVISHFAAAAVINALWHISWVFSITLAERLFGWKDLWAAIEPQNPVLFGVGLLYYLLVTAFHYLLLAQDASQQAEQRLAEARFLAQRSELKALKAQINPHFLYNSLHSISALTATDPPKAREMCILLSEFLRSTLGLGEKRSIPLASELELIRKYLVIERVRFGRRLRFEEEIEDGAEACNLPPLLLQPLVENAVKHGVSSMVEETRVALYARAKDGVLQVVVENEFDPDAAPRSRGGVGLRNVHERLLAAYGRRAGVRTSTKDHTHRVEVRLPAERGGTNE